MYELSIFNNMSQEEIDNALKNLGARRITFRKDHIIISNLVDDDLIGIIINGKASIVNYDYEGNRDIIDTLEYNNVFGKPFFNINSDVSIIANTDCEVLFIDANLLVNGNTIYNKINFNINRLLTNKIYTLYDKLEILSKRTIREKLLSYFSNLSKKYHKKTFNLPITYIELADYLSVDRSAMMREIKKLRDEKKINTDGKKITIN
jgi:CRP-like cAMP-binding protein